MRRFAQLLAWLLLRSWRHHPVRQALTWFSLALGVALYLATDLTLGAIGRAVGATQEALAAGADLTISRGTAGVQPDELLRLRARAEFARLAPGVQATCYVLEQERRGPRLVLVGVDAAEAARFLGSADAADAAARIDLVRLALDARSLVLTELGAKRLGVTKGASLRLTTPSGEATFVVAGLVEPPPAAREALAGFAFLPLAAAQSRFGRGAKVDRVDVVLAPGCSREEGRRIARELVPGANVTTHAERSEDQVVAIAGFRAMLVLESLLVFLVALFFVYNTVSASVADRAHDAGLLRCLGITRGGLRLLFLGEAACSGLIGLALGIGLGWVLGRLALDFMVESVGLLYFPVPPVDTVHLEAAQVLTAGALALGVASIAAWLASRPLTGRAVLEFLRPSASATVHLRGLRRTAGLGLLALVVAALLPLVVRPGSAFPLGRAVSLLLPAGIGLVAPHAFVLLSTWLRARIANRGNLALLLALDAARIHPARTAMTVTAFALSLGLVVGHGAVGNAMTATLREWLVRSVPGHVILGTTAASPVPSFPVDSKLLDPLRTLPGVVDVVRVRLVRIRAPRYTYMCLALDVAAAQRHSSKHFVAGDPERAAARCAAGTAVVISENLALRTGLGVGDPLALPTAEGTLELEIAGVIRDYNSPLGTAYLDYALYERAFRDSLIDFGELCVDSATLRELPAFVTKVQAALAPEFRSVLTVLGKDEFIGGAIAAVEEINSLSAVQIALSSLIGSVGILVTVTLSVLSRRRELALLRAVGMDRGTARRTVAWEVAGLALAATFVGLLIGNLVFWPANLVFREFAGFAFAYRAPWLPSLWALGVAIVTALVSMVLPLRALQRLDPLVDLE